ncbi:MAG: sensor histidine kinase [Alphaproteobacteria bacterium]
MSLAALPHAGNFNRTHAGAIAPRAGAAGALLAQYSLHLGDTILRHRAEVAERASRIDAELASQVKSDFITNISHELRTPLHSILGFSNMLKGAESSPLKLAQVAEYANFIHGSAENLLFIINDVITISKLQSGKLALAMDHIEGGELLPECASWARSQVEQTGHHFVSLIDEDLPLIWADHQHLKDVLKRLLTNAIHFTPPGGTIALSAKLRTNGALMICVSDTGTGMTAEETAEALTVFGQLDNRLDRQNEGTGLGLPISKALVELQGGTFSLISNKGEGTHVVLQFPHMHERARPRPWQEQSHAG